MLFLAIWVLTNRKPEHRRGKVQLIDVTGWYQPLRKTRPDRPVQETIQLMETVNYLSNLSENEKLPFSARFEMDGEDANPPT